MTLIFLACIMSALFTRIEPHPLLVRYIDKIWLFQSNGHLPAEDMKLVVPNGRLKISVSFQNSMVARLENSVFETKEHTVAVTGLFDRPLCLDTGSNAFTSTIVIEFNPVRAYRFFPAAMKEISNQIISVQEMIGGLFRQIETQVAEKNTVAEKIELIQSFLLKQLTLTRQDQIFEYCIDKILSSRGTISVNELENKTGYSSRWLNMKFDEKLGLSPKNFASIIRFSHCYQSFLNSRENHFLHNDFYHYYYDQSHFLRAFKRFTGLTPKRFENSQNGFETLFQKQ